MRYCLVLAVLAFFLAVASAAPSFRKDKDDERMFDYDYVLNDDEHEDSGVVIDRLLQRHEKLPVKKDGHHHHHHHHHHNHHHKEHLKTNRVHKFFDDFRF